MIQGRLGDEKSTVRKGAIQFLKAITIFELREWKSTSIIRLLSLIEERSQDPVMSIRKETMECLDDILNSFPRNQDLWRFFSSFF